MNTIDVFGRLHGRMPDDEDIKRLHSIASVLNVADDDNFMALLILLDYYTGMFSQAPDTITDTVMTACKEARTTAEAEIRAGASTAFAALSQAASRTIEQAAHESIVAHSRRMSAIWISVCALICTAVLCCGMYFAYALGAKTEAAKMQAARDWIDGPTGQAVAQCNVVGWIIENRNGQPFCFPSSRKDGQMQGFPMPF